MTGQSDPKSKGKIFGLDVSDPDKFKVTLNLALLVAMVAWHGGLAGAQVDYKESKLEAFVTAAIAVRQVAQAWNPRIRAAKSREEAGKMIAQASTEMTAAIERVEGITVEEYAEIRDAAPNQPELAAQINEIYRRMQAE